MSTEGRRNGRATKISCRAVQENLQTNWGMERKLTKGQSLEKVECWPFFGRDWSGKVY